MRLSWLSGRAAIAELRQDNNINKAIKIKKKKIYIFKKNVADTEKEGQQKLNNMEQHSTELSARWCEG